MSSENIYRLIDFDEHAATPKYLQLTNCIIKAVQEGKLQKDYVLPSINDLSYELDMGRNTVEKAYRHLKELGIVNSFPGKGYFISKSTVQPIIKVFLLFNKLSAHKKIIYDAFVSTLCDAAAIDFYIYNNDFSLFKKLLQQRKDDYHYYVIIPHFLEGGEHAADIINELSKGQLILLDKLIAGVTLAHGAVYENFEKDIYTALKEALPSLLKYQTLKIVFPSYTYFPEEIVKGFRSFCQEFAFDYKVVHKLQQEEIRTGEAYINLMEDDLVVLLEKIQSTELVVGKDVGIISYNETPWKKFILDGITTMSTDFKKMGEMAARMILQKERVQVEVPFTLTIRSSI
ncbi:GntR family transcriptional regulator [Flavisolibacter nicotianae]|uniref:GntR family transcriptional regulator n=1 Tax=Flavisolibacter nicotianae TaxID=2364882 RepID=UPI000EB12F56|nr:GntR family transcriptional regulator [Flavisolibacter nicotianae]